MSNRFCTECGSALEPADRFCTSCGTAVRAAAAPVAATAAPATPAPAPVAPPAPRAKKGGSFFTWEIRLGLLAAALSALAALATDTPPATAAVSAGTALVTVFVAVLVLHILWKTRILLVLALLLLLGGGATAGYLVAPDLPAVGIPSERDLQRAFPFLRPQADRPITAPASPRPAAQKALAARVAQIREEMQRGQRYLDQLKAAGLPVISAQIIPSARGDVLHVGVSYERLTSALSGTAGVVETFDALIRVAQQRSLDLKGIRDVTVAAVDAQGRALFSASAPAEAVERFRAGQMDRKAFLATAGFKGESRLALLDALRGLLTSVTR